MSNKDSSTQKPIRPQNQLCPMSGGTPAPRYNGAIDEGEAGLREKTEDGTEDIDIDDIEFQTSMNAEDLIDGGKSGEESKAKGIPNVRGPTKMERENNVSVRGDAC